MFRSDWPGFGGGVALCCLTYLQPAQVPFNSSSGCDIVAVDLHGPVTCRLVCCYRPPSTSLADTIQFCHDLSKLADCQLPLVLVGDFNMPRIDWKTLHAPNSPLYATFLDFVDNAALSQLVLEPTCFDNILDLIFTTDPLFVSSVKVVEGFANSDHSAVTFFVCGSITECPLVTTQERNFRKMDIGLAKYLLSKTDWLALFEPANGDANILWAIFLQVINEVFDVTVPTKPSQSRHGCYPKPVQKLLSKKRFLYRKWRSSGAKADKLAYNQCSFDCSADIRSTRLQQEHDVLVSGSASRFFAYARQCRTARTGVAPLNTPQGPIAVTDSDKAATLQAQFSSVFTRDDGCLPQFPDRASGSQIDDFAISREDVRRVLCKTPMKYGPTPDGIPCAVFGCYRLNFPTLC